MLLPGARTVIVTTCRELSRTGLVVAAWRVRTGEMPPSQAWAEALAGFL